MVRLGVWFSLVWCILVFRLQADTISLDPGSPSVPAPVTSPGDLVTPGGAIPDTIGGVNTNAFTYGRTPAFHPATAIHFTVDRGAVGAAGTAVAVQVAAPGETASADVFAFTGIVGGNILVHDGDGSAASLSAIALDETATPPFDDIDALDVFSTPVGPGFWSVDPGTIGGVPPYAGFSSADVFTGIAVYPTPPPPASTLYATAAALGLVGADDIDGLEIIDVGASGVFDAGDTVFFSLAPGSPSIGALGGAPGGGDIFSVAFGGAPGLFLPFGALGLTGGDNLNGFSFVPEPTSGVALLVAMVPALFRRRRA